MSGYMLTYILTMHNPKIYTLKFVTISIFMIFLHNRIFLRICFSLQENQFPLLLLLNKCKALLFIGYRCLNLRLYNLVFQCFHPFPCASLSLAYHGSQEEDSERVCGFDKVFVSIWHLTQKQLAQKMHINSCAYF